MNLNERSHPGRQLFSIETMKSSVEGGSSALNKDPALTPTKAALRGDFQNILAMGCVTTSGSESP